MIKQDIKFKNLRFTKPILLALSCTVTSNEIFPFFVDIIRSFDDLETLQKNILTATLIAQSPVRNYDSNLEHLWEHHILVVLPIFIPLNGRVS